MATNLRPLIARVLFSLVFLVSGTFKLAGYSQVVQMAGAKGIPLPGIAIACAAAIELLGALAMLAGFKARIVAWMWIVYLIPVTLTFHHFWNMTGMEQQDNLVHFLLNLALMGGLLYVTEFGAGSYSVGARDAQKA
ncbi:MAG TPA: DoxX family protein [Candidatus Sulfotelmatobacter sp.]|nr:DoxX family protein [Candidatus Sulfotelmatobacter sp.]